MGPSSAARAFQSLIEPAFRKVSYGVDLLETQLWCLENRWMSTCVVWSKFLHVSRNHSHDKSMEVSVFSKKDPLFIKRCFSGSNRSTSRKSDSYSENETFNQLKRSTFTLVIYVFIVGSLIWVSAKHHNHYTASWNERKDSMKMSKMEMHTNNWQENYCVR